MAKPGDKVKCGDTEYCEDCESRDNIESATDGERVLSANDKGRCDFYSGPGDDITTVHVKPIYVHDAD